jgi:hypothetical protein
VGAGVVVLIALYAINLPYEVRYLRIHHELRERGKGALQFSSVLDVERICRDTLLIRQDSLTLTESLHIIDQFQLMDPPRRRTPLLVEAEDRPRRSTKEYGEFESLGQDPKLVTAVGWAYLPDERRPPAGVILAYRMGEAWRAFSFSESSEPRRDLVAMFKDRSYLVSGWKQSVARILLPLEVQEISAWALDAETGETYRLPGSFEMK